MIEVLLRAWQKQHKNENIRGPAAADVGPDRERDDEEPDEREDPNPMPNLTIKTDNKTLSVEQGASIIDVCENEETSILFGCRDGACGACMVRVLTNPQNLSKMEDHERDFLETMAARDDERLACQCKVLGDVTIEVSE